MTRLPYVTANFPLKFPWLILYRIMFQHCTLLQKELIYRQRNASEDIYNGV